MRTMACGVRSLRLDEGRLEAGEDEVEGRNVSGELGLDDVDRVLEEALEEGVGREEGLDGRERRLERDDDVEERLNNACADLEGWIHHGQQWGLGPACIQLTTSQT